MATPPRISPSRIGTFRIEVDGEWDIEDLRDVSGGLSEAYGLFYPLMAEDEEVRARLQDSLRKTFWTGDVDSRFIGERLYRQIPTEESLKLKSFQYASQGAMTVVGVLSVLFFMAKVTNAWVKTGDAIFELWKKVDAFFEKRRHLRRPRKNFELDDDMALNSDEARNLVFAAGIGLGFTPHSCETLIDIVGNPFSALKFLVAVGKEGRKLAELQGEGKLAFPAPNTGAIELPPAAGSKRRGRVEVVRTRPRRGPKK
jgi:hypothetical protein